MCDTRVEQLEKVQTEARELFRKKNADYGDSFATYGTVGILVRLGDKIRRLQSITSKGINLVEDEKIRDTLLDLHNYAAMGIMLLDSEEDPKISLPPIESTSLELVVEDINIIGSTGNTYNIKKFKHNNGKVILICSCPSFKFCSDTCKTCKHIKQLNS